MRLKRPPYGRLFPLGMGLRHTALVSANTRELRNRTLTTPGSQRLSHLDDVLIFLEHDMWIACLYEGAQ